MKIVKMEFRPAKDIHAKLQDLIEKLQFLHIDRKQIHCFRSLGSKSRAIARIWSLPRVWQLALAVSPAYVIEVISEKYDGLTTAEQEKVLIHELLHIPKTFSGSLVPHRCFGRRIDRRRVEQYFKAYQIAKNSA